jgi:hypothetical protein
VIIILSARTVQAIVFIKCRRKYLKWGNKKIN